MILNSDAEKITPKTKAQDLLMDAIAVCRGYWTEKENEDIDKMTKKEIEKTHDQLKKLSDRVAKKMGYDESWVG